MREPRLRRMKGFSSYPGTPAPPDPPSSGRIRRISTKPCFPITLSPWIYSTKDDATSMAASPGNNATPQEFHLFGKLPLELRRKIWGFATPPPWIITRNTAYFDSNGYIRQVPAVLHACKESREEFLFSEEVQKDHPTFKLVSGLVEHNLDAVFVSMEQDVVVIDSEHHLMCKELMEAQHIALPSYGFPKQLELLLQWPNLEHIYCIDSEGFQNTGSKYDKWFLDTEVRGLGHDKKNDQEISKRPQVSYLSPLIFNDELQSGPLFLGDPVVRLTRISHDNDRAKMRCCLFGQREAQDMDGSGEILTKRIADIECRIVRVIRCGGGRRWDSGG